MSFWQTVKQILWGEAIVLDEAGNVILGPDPKVQAAGNPHYTISQRLAEMRSNGSRFGCVACKLLTWIQNALPWASRTKDHCADAMQGMPTNIPSEG